MKKILFLTTSNLATNPRLVKELNLAKTDYEIAAIGFKIGGWSDDVDKKILTTWDGLTITYLSALKAPFLNWFVSGILHVFAGKFWKTFREHLVLNAFSSNKRSFQLWWYFYKNKNNFKQFDFVVAHNLGTLFPAYYISKKLNIPFVFDVEDFHPGEKIEHDAKNEALRRKFLLKKLLPKAIAVTVASPLIGIETEKLTGCKTTYIANSFYSNEFIPPVTETNSSVLSLVWFSQNIDSGRGLEGCIKALGNFSGQVSLTLIGNLNKDFATKWIDGKPFIQIKEPMPQSELHKELAKYDIGLALEMSSADFNRGLALTNKIFAYLQSGLYILATDTLAQKTLLQKFEEHGVLSKQNPRGFIIRIQELLENKEKIRSSRLKRYNAAKMLAFEHEANKLKTMWNSFKSKKN